MAELVAGEADDDKPLGCILLIKCFQPIVLRGKAAPGGGVDNQEDLPLVLGEVQLFAVVGFSCKVKDGCLAAVQAIAQMAAKRISIFFMDAKLR